MFASPHVVPAPELGADLRAAARGQRDNIVIRFGKAIVSAADGRTDLVGGRAGIGELIVLALRHELHEHGADLGDL